MRFRFYSDWATDLIGRMLFPDAQREVQRRDLRFFGLSILLGTMVCLAFAFLLLMLNRLGRI